MWTTGWICLLPAMVGAVMTGCAPASELDLLTAGVDVALEDGGRQGLTSLLCDWLEAGDECVQRGLSTTGADGMVMGAYGEDIPRWSEDVGAFHGRFVRFDQAERGQLHGSWVNHLDGSGGYLQGESYSARPDLAGSLVGEYLPFDDAAGSVHWSWVLPELREIRVIEGVYRSVADSPGGRFLGVYQTADDPDPTVHKLRIRNEIDGRSSMEIGTYDATYTHHDYAAPGRHFTFGEDDPSSQPARATWLQDAEWYPEWPSEGENRDCGCSSSTFFSQPPDGVLVPFADADITMEVLEGRGEVTILEEPSAANDYRLTIEWDDNPQGGPAWYEVEITFETY